MKSHLLVLLLSCFLLNNDGAVAEIIPGSSAMSRIFATHPSLVGGGESVESFACWANCRYLLPDAVAVGEIFSLGEGVSAFLFIAQGKPVLSFWSNNKQATNAHIKLFSAARLYSYGNLTRKLSVNNVEISASEYPQFIINCSRSYLAEGLNAEITTVMASLNPLLAQSFSEGTVAKWQTLTAFNFNLSLSETVYYLQQQQDMLDSMISTVVQLPLKDNDTLLFNSAWQMLSWRLRLGALRAGYRQLIGKKNSNSPFSPIDEQTLMDGYLYNLAQAEPKTALRSRPKSGLLLRNAIYELQNQQGKSSLFQQESLIFIHQIIPYLLAIESPVVQNIAISAKISYAVDTAELMIMLQNNSAEKAEGWLEFTWRNKAERRPFEIEAAKSATMRFTITDTADLAKVIQLSGSLTDGTPLLPINVTVQQ